MKMTAKMTISTMANLYKTIGDYSKESLDIQVKQIEEKYINEQRYASHTKEQLIILEKAKNTEIFNLRNAAEKKLLDMQLSYAATIYGVTSTQYKDLTAVAIRNQIDILEQQFKNAGLAFDRRAMMTVLENEAKQKSLQIEYDYYSQIAGFEQIAFDKKMKFINLEKEARINAAHESAKAVDEMYKKGLVGVESVIAAHKEEAQIVSAATQKATQDTMSAQNSIIDGIKSRFDQEHKYQNESLTNAIAVFDNASALMDKESSEYKLMQDMKEAAQIAELALIVAKNAAVLAGIPAIAAATTAAAGQAVVQGAAATLTAGTGGDGYTAFARIAAMMAIVAAVLSAAGIVGGTNSSGSASLPALPKSTVLGAADGTGSESIQKSWELMQDTYDMEYRELSGIYDEMKTLNTNITGLVTSYIRTGGISAEGIGTSTMGAAEKAWLNAADSTIGGIFTGHLVTDAIFGNNSQIGNFLTKISDVFTGWTGSLIGSIFGGGTKTWSGGSGISLGATSISNLQQGAAMPASYYAVTGHKTDGGWFGSDKTWVTTSYQAINEDVQNLITKVFSGMGSTLVSLSSGLGADIQKALNYTFKSVAVNLEGLDAEAVTKKLNETFSGIMDTAASDLFGDAIRKYQEVGEGLMETATRLLTNKAIVSYWIDKMNQSFQGTIPEAIKFSDTLVTIAGSLEDLTDAMQTYYDKFFSDSEKQAKLKKELMGEFSALGYGLPGDRAGYRSLVESLNLTTDAGQAAYVALMQMSESADTYYQYLEDAKDAVKSKISPENYTTNLAYQRALAGLPSYADGGVAVGPISGYEATLHGTELIVSPRTSYPATVKGGNNDELLSEIRALRAELGAGNYQIAANTQKSAKYLQYLEQWDDDGLPPERS